MLIIMFIVLAIWYGICNKAEWNPDIFKTGATGLIVGYILCVAYDTIGEVIGLWTTTLNY